MRKEQLKQRALRPLKLFRVTSLLTSFLWNWYEGFREITYLGGCRIEFSPAVGATWFPDIALFHSLSLEGPSTNFLRFSPMMCRELEVGRVAHLRKTCYRRKLLDNNGPKENDVVLLLLQ